MKRLDLSRNLLKTVLYAVMLAAGLAAYYGVSPNSNYAIEAGAEGADALERAFMQRRSKVWVEVEGVVVRLLPDDNDGSRHQRLILEIAGGQTLLIAHNIDLAPRVPVSVSDSLILRGRYEWNEKGGVLHWTHHDPKKEIAGGWIEHKGKRYQ